MRKEEGEYSDLCKFKASYVLCLTLFFYPLFLVFFIKIIIFITLIIMSVHFHSIHYLF